MATKTLTDWKSTWVELMGAEVKYYQGKNWFLRGIEMGDPSSEPLILLHGIGGHGETYARNIPNLAKHFHVYAMDMLYHGYSQKEPFDGANIIDGYVDSLVEFIKGEGLKRPHIEGESLGSIVAFFLGMNYPDVPGKLILNTGAPVKWKNLKSFMDDPNGMQALAERSLESVNNVSPESVRKRLEWLMADPSRVTDELVDVRFKLYSDPAVRQSMINVYTNAFIDKTMFSKYWVDEEYCANLKPESMVFWTEFNPGEGPEVGQHFSDIIPGSKYYCMKDAAHWPQWEHPEEHDQALIDFIGGKM
jgi:pimeloyl-ACP methyl ester carboxylesterase